MKAIRFDRNRLYYIDQRMLPAKEAWKECRTIAQGYSAIKTLSVRGAPLIGVFAAYCIAISCNRFSEKKNIFITQTKEAICYLKSCRPTAVNLSWALHRMEEALLVYQNTSVVHIRKKLLETASALHRQDVYLCRRMAHFGAALINAGDAILTHCNAGFLATSGIGTAIAPIYEANRSGKKIHIFIDETRPLLQGARLTAWELKKAKIPCTLVCDNMAAYLMQQGKIDKVFVGADRIACNGDTANKVGTYSVAVNAKHHKIPFYVVAPFSTFDTSLKTGRQIPIEERNPEEITNVLSKLRIAPEIDVYNPAFDVTPHALISAIICDKGVIYPPYKKNIAEIIK